MKKVLLAILTMVLLLLLVLTVSMVIVCPFRILPWAHSRCSWGRVSGFSDEVLEAEKHLLR